MTVADGSQTRLADIAEATIGTTPATPAFQIMRYVSSDLRLAKQVDIPNEIRADGNVASITDVGRMVQGSINTLLSYGTYDVWLARLLRSSWATNVLKNGMTHAAGTLEATFEQGATDSFIRYVGCRFNSLDLQLRARQSVTANWGIMGLRSPTPTTAIITGATYLAASTTEVFNAGKNVASLVFTGIATPPKINALSLRIANNIYANDIIGSYEPDSHGLGRFDCTGSFTALFENLDTYNAILNHDDVTIGFTLNDEAGNSYAVSMPKTKLLDGGPTVGGNGQAVIIEVPFQARYDSSSAASLTITRTPA
ncbi:MAG: hypothetical protein LCH86_20830 [Proteobacteria bacterium]|nr:hypothetical protein [Pseudomonadota bacterium]